MPGFFYECFVDVEDVNEGEFNRIQRKCDGRSICSYEYSGQIVHVCRSQTIASHVEVIYDCQPINENIPFAFTVLNPIRVDRGGVVNFREILSNFGNMFDPEN